MFSQQIIDNRHWCRRDYTSIKSVHVFDSNTSSCLTHRSGIMVEERRQDSASWHPGAQESLQDVPRDGIIAGDK